MPRSIAVGRIRNRCSNNVLPTHGGSVLAIRTGKSIILELAQTITDEWRFEEANASDNIAPSVGSLTLVQTNNPARDGTSRTFALASTQQAKVTATNSIAGIGINFSGSVNYTWTGVNPTNYNVFGCRNDGSGDANITYLLRRAGATMNLEFFIGNGNFSGADYLTMTTVAVNQADAGDHCFQWSFNRVTGEVRYSLDGAAVVSSIMPANSIPATLMANPFLLMGGLGGEYADVKLKRARLARGFIWSDAVLRYQDSRGV